MITWELLTKYSSLESGTAWEHLNSQEGGGTGETIIVDSFGLEVSMEEVIFEQSQEFTISLDSSDLVVDMENQIISSEEPQEFIVELEDIYG